MGVRRRHGDAGKATPQDRERRVHDRHAEDDETREHEMGLALVAEHQDDHGAHVAQKKAPAVAEEDHRRVEVVRKEAQDRAEQRKAQHDAAARSRVGAGARQVVD